jgi:hypothetical protein
MTGLVVAVVVGAFMASLLIFGDTHTSPTQSGGGA